MGAVLYQLDTNGNKLIMNYVGTKLSKTQQKYHSNKYECLVIVWDLHKQRPHLKGSQFRLHTDIKCVT
ncbi:hypothetical protein PR048_012485 [Dryococelus australis]|uniref:Reverse transcriptase RNase H-like domain-containing protein n=1 Tax=Dryococelus australis TaxID=614101 RepID=A0ABQ9HPI9_9NEOP|nr:hypothetical protein PR048_012485 [Dryococelus australis]